MPRRFLVTRKVCQPEDDQDFGFARALVFLIDVVDLDYCFNAMISLGALAMLSRYRLGVRVAVSMSCIDSRSDVQLTDSKCAHYRLRLHAHY